jgi:hypothetical protein
MRRFLSSSVAATEGVVAKRQKVVAIPPLTAPTSIVATSPTSAVATETPSIISSNSSSNGSNDNSSTSGSSCGSSSSSCCCSSGSSSRLPLPLREGELMHSTSAKSAKRKWVALTEVLSCRDGTRSYCSTDGSSTGWHSAVFVPSTVEGVEPIAHLRAKWGDMKGSRNVGAEASGFLLGMQTASLPEYSNRWRNIVFLADFLNALAWSVGGAKYNHEVLVAVYGEVNAIKLSKMQTSNTSSYGSKEELHWDCIHHPGHQTDTSWYTQLNQVADNLASLQLDVDVIVPLSVLTETLTAQGKGSKELVLAAINAATSITSTVTVSTSVVSLKKAKF